MAPLLAYRSGAILDTYPDDAFGTVRNLTRAALRSARGTSAIAHEGGRGHASLGYAFDHADSDPLQSALRRISPSHAPLTVEARWRVARRPGDRDPRRSSNAS